jgi:hypothetical protein
MPRLCQSYSCVRQAMKINTAEIMIMTTATLALAVPRHLFRLIRTSIRSEPVWKTLEFAV